MMLTILNILIVVVIVFVVLAMIAVVVDLQKDLMRKKVVVRLDGEEVEENGPVTKKGLPVIKLSSSESIDITWRVHESKDPYKGQAVVVKQIDDKPEFRVDSKY